MSTVRVGIIGCGRISGHHCRSIVAVDGADLIAVCDLDTGKAESYGREFRVPFYTDYRRMLQEHPEINTVVVATPSGMHFEHAVELIQEFGKSVVVEKPTFMKPSQLQKAYDVATTAGVKVYPVFQNRHNAAVQRVFAGIRTGELGAVRSVSVRVRWCRPQRYYDLAPWRGTFAMDGGCLTNQGVHHIDLLRLLGGEVTRVCSLHRTLGANIEVEDTASAVFEFGSGAIGTLEVTTAARPVDYEASLSLVCENGLAQIGGIAVNELQVYTPEPTACQPHSEDFSGNVYGNGHRKIYEEIVADARGTATYSVCAADAHATIKLLNSFYRSSESGGWVALSSVEESVQLGCQDDALASLYRTPR